MDEPSLSHEPSQLSAPAVTAKDLLTMGTNDVIAYRTLPARLREVLSIMNPADAIAAFHLS